jgi:serine/threonine-protein kinase
MLAAGTRLGPYEVLSSLGAGGMGEVYRARDTRLDREVAVKVLAPQLAADPEFRARFDREARAVSSLDHPHICPLYDVGEAPAPSPESPAPVRFLVMQLLEGETLAARLEGVRAKAGQAGLPLDEALKIATQVCDALDHAHRIGVVHRDLKPANIFLTKTGPKLLDFGLAKRRPAGAGIVSGMSVAATQASPITASGTILGTLQYMAPEQLEGQEADSRADIFSFGAVLYEMITGRKAFDGKSQASLIAAILHIDPPPMTTLQPVTPAALERVVTTCLAKDADDRWQSARDLLRELKWVADGATTPVLPQRAAPAQASRVAWALASVCALAAIIGGFIAIRHLRETSPAPRTVTRFTVALPATSPLSVGGVRSSSILALAPDGTRLVVASGSGASAQLYLRAMDQLEAVPIRGTQGAVAPFFSPDGQWLGFFTDDRLKKISIDSGSAQTITTIGIGGAFISASWGSDDTIMFTSLSGELMRVPAAGGTPTQATTLDTKQGETAHRSPEILPGGKAVLFVAQRAIDAELMIRHLDTGEQRSLGIGGGSSLRYVSSGHLLFVRAGTLFAAPFDLKQLRVTAPPVPVVEQVASNGPGGAARVAIAANGSIAYVPGGENVPARTLVWVDRAGNIQPLLETPRDFREARLSPDGQRIAIGIEGRPRDLWIYEIKRGTLSRFTLEPSESEFAAWTPDGQRIAFGALRPGQGRVLLWKLTDGSGSEEKLLVGGPQDHFHPSAWSPDGRVLALTNVSSTDTNYDILMLPLGKTVPEPFAKTRFNERAPRFSSDGRWVAYVSEESGRGEIYVQPYPGPGGKRQISVDGGSEPVWAANGREMFYWVEDKMMAVSVTTSPTFNADTPRVLFEGRFERPVTNFQNFDVTADGQRFLMFKGTQAAAAAQITVVLDWATELARRVPIPR